MRKYPPGFREYIVSKAMLSIWRVFFMFCFQQMCQQNPVLLIAFLCIFSMVAPTPFTKYPFLISHFQPPALQPLTLVALFQIDSYWHKMRQIDFQDVLYEQKSFLLLQCTFSPICRYAAICMILFLQGSYWDMVIQMLVDDFCLLFWCPFLK